MKKGSKAKDNSEAQMCDIMNKKRQGYDENIKQEGEKRQSLVEHQVDETKFKYTETYVSAPE